MQINKEKALIKLSSFTNFIKTKDNYKNLKLASFAFKIPEFNIVDLLDTDYINKNDSFYWKIKEEKIEFLSIIPLISFNEFGEDRLAKTKNRILNIESRFVSNWESVSINHFPIVVGGLKFAPNQYDKLWKDYSDSDWFIPTLTFFKNDEECYLIYNFFVESNFKNCSDSFSNLIDDLNNINFSQSEPELILNSPQLLKETSFEKWNIILNKALNHISEGYLSKVVLSREVIFQLEDQISLVNIMKLLAYRYPKCYTFLYKRKDSLFFGTTPEKLAKISNGWIEVDALAGSIHRGKTPEEDAQLESELLNSKKNLFEQRAVVHFINNLLQKFSDEITFSDHPQIRKLPNIQHLWTIMRAKIKDNVKMLDILSSLHPTPAICGDPWKLAMDFILENESHNRGLYSGNVGWFNFDGFGEFAVAIRSALLKESILSAYAGCGIVEGSEPKSEFIESEIKLKPILTLFADEKVCQS